jgi:ABC-type phosphate transport system substrate-binding protein
MKQIMIATFLFLTHTGSLSAQEHILVGGSGGLIPVMQELAEAYHGLARG